MPELLRVTPADDGGVAVLTLDRADRKNALSIALRDEISDALDALAADEAVKVVVVTGSGDVFCAGFDLGEFQVDEAGFQQRLWASSDRFHATVLGFPLPTVAALNGPAIAGGFDLAVMCDLRVAATTTWFAHPEHTFSDVVYGPLRDLVGGSLARELVLTGRRLTAEEARAAGLVTAVVDPGEVVAEGLRVAGEIAAAPRDVLVRMKAKLLRLSGVTPAGATLDL